jgi:hypothetical protein
MSSLMVVAAIVLLATGCLGGSSKKATGSPASASPVTADSVLTAASQEWAQTNSAHFQLSIEGNAFLDSAQTLKLISAEGDIKRPDSVSAVAKLALGPLSQNVSLIAIGTDTYMSGIASGTWERAPKDFQYNPSILFSETEGIGPILTKLQSAKLEANEKVNGTDAHKITGTVDAATVSGISSGAIQGQSIAVTLWIGVKDAKILKVALAEPPGIRDQPATWTLLITDHNKDVKIEAPPVGSPVT